ncbi:nucleotidyltransferase family protein [Velocimicrobium porci]|uniref:Nucleotidyltransferase domain-containing protein n=1 Tax=Velocimicrobium porci TaxID=2606634 RepID=A0A6L5Y2C6_9FIRM|nr:nucleotidyltransferase domain-containing protein [Velocimicrobium porci]MSS64518.1 nucleotidyltransferase domain-containing protein [Velocimicrobium porci]
MKIDETIGFLSRNKRDFLLEKIELLTKKIETLQYIILFGSYARGEETATSDIDILVITEKPTERFLRGELCSELEEEQVDLIFYTLNQFRSSDCLFVRQVKKEGVVLWKKN